MILLEIIYKIMKEFCELLLSLPAWERGLKFRYSILVYLLPVSLPAWERGLKLKSVMTRGAETQSLPAWERGLKFLVVQ